MGYDPHITSAFMSAPLPGSITETVGRQFVRNDQAEGLRLLAEYECDYAALRRLWRSSALAQIS